MTLVDTGSALRDACEATGLDGSGAVVLGAHATTVYHLPRENVVVRLSRAESAPAEARRAVEVCRWLAGHDFPAPLPLAVVQPVPVEGHVATFWQYYPQSSPELPTLRDLGALLRRLHDLPAPPVELPEYRPLDALRGTVSASSCLSPSDKSFLLDEYERLLAAYAELDSPLGAGHIHGDAYFGNLLADGTRILLSDWDETSIGPRELDLANTYHYCHRFGQPTSQLETFADAYGYDLADWSGLATLRAMRAVHSLGAYILRADHDDPAAGHELHYRIGTLRRGEIDAVWTSAVPLSTA